MVSFDLGAEQMTEQHGRQFIRSVLEKVSAVPGVASVAIGANAPLAGGFLQTIFREGDPVDPHLGLLMLTLPVTPGYFDTMRIRLVAGRGMNDFDRSGTRRVAVISEAMARRVWPGQPALGRCFRSVSVTDLYGSWASSKTQRYSPSASRRSRWPTCHLIRPTSRSQCCTCGRPPLPGRCCPP